MYFESDTREPLQYCRTPNSMYQGDRPPPQSTPGDPFLRRVGTRRKGSAAGERSYRSRDRNTEVIGRREFCSRLSSPVAAPRPSNLGPSGYHRAQETPTQAKPKLHILDTTFPAF